MKKILAFLLAFLIGALTLLPTAKNQTVEAAPPANFQTNQIIGIGLDGPSGFEFAPDGRIFILERTGNIKVFKNGQLLEQPFATLPSVATGDRGLIGIAFDPDWETTPYVYFYYTGLDLLNRLVRFDASGDVAPEGPHILYQTTFPSQQLHVGGSIRFGPDGKMYFAVGDNGYPPNAQDFSNPHGKILRINKNGTIPTDNPFYGQPTKLPEIWAYGFRNPWRFQFDSATGKLYGGDVGDFTIEEVNHIQKGKNYGWPICEGVCNEPGIVDPIYNYPHDGMGSAVTGGPIYRSSMFPPEYQGSLFFGDYARGFIKRLTLDADGNATALHDFDLNAGSVVDMKIAPDGSMYYLTYFPGRLYRVTYSLGNQIPVANASADNTKGLEPFTVNFTSTGSFDPDGDSLTYSWDFGDGTNSSEQNPTKTYTVKGTYIVELTVSDSTTSANAIPIVIQVGTPPTITIGEPANGSTYRAGDTIHYTAFAQDGAGFDINDANITTEVIFHHNIHTHPFLGPIQGRQGTFTVPTTGEAAADTWFQILATATDDNGLSSTASIEIFPEKSFITFASNIPGAQILLDGVPTVTSSAFEQVEGFTREVSSPLLQVINGVLYQFSHWSDGGFIRHIITIPQDDTTLTAFYTQAPAFNAQYYNNTNLDGPPALVREDNLIDFVWGDSSPAPEINTDFFSARWTKDQHFIGGKYKFTIAADDGVRLFIDGNLVVDEWRDQAQSFEYTTEIAEGTHNITLEYYEAAGGSVAKLVWDLTQDQPVQNVYSASYFNNMTLSGAPVLTKNEADINYDWGQGSPDALVPTDGFSARWTKTAEFAAGAYEFITTSDDGIRVFVDDSLVIDKWIDQPATTHKGQKILTQGNHTIRVEYYENGGGATAVFSYSQATSTPESYEGKYWNLSPDGAFVIPSTTPDFTRSDTTIDFDWGGGSPATGINPDNFAASWTKTAQFEASNYEFTATADDGIRLSIDNELILDKWIDQPPTTYKVNKLMSAGDHQIKIDYYEKGGGATVKMNYVKTPEPPNPVGTYTANYWNIQSTDASPQIPTAAPDFQSTVNAIDFIWDGRSPDPSIATDHFAARYTKLHNFEAGTYEFTTTADDGVRIFIDNELIIDKWIDQPSTTYTVDRLISAGEHEIKIEYYENAGGAVLIFGFTKTTEPEQNPYSAEFWNTAPGAAPSIPATTPDLTRTDNEINYRWFDSSPDPVINTDNFVARWTKTQELTQGTYKLTTLSDDGIRVFIDNDLVIDQWNDHAETAGEIEVPITSGTHIISVEYYENGGGATAQFSYEKISGDLTIQDAYLAEYFNNMTLSGTPALIRNDRNISFNWGAGSPDSSINPENFSARYIKNQAFTAGDYTFTVTADDGVRVYIDGGLIIDKWIDQPSTTYSQAVNLTDGIHEIKVEYYENTGGAVLDFSYN